MSREIAEESGKLGIKLKLRLKSKDKGHNAYREKPAIS